MIDREDAQELKDLMHLARMAAFKLSQQMPGRHLPFSITSRMEMSDLARAFDRLLQAERKLAKLLE